MKFSWQGGIGVLTGIYVSRMLGLFMVFPVFSLYAQTLDGSNKALIGVALSMYGLSQGMLQIPYGWLSDRFGRKPMIISGLLLFIAGSILAAAATSIHAMIIARAVQGMGAISAVTLAYATDITPVEKLGRTMAIIGGSIGMSFVLSLILGPMIAAWIGVKGLFVMIAVMGSVALISSVFLPQAGKTQTGQGHYQRYQLWQAAASIFLLHAVFAATFLVLPHLLIAGGIDKMHHWWIYLPANIIALGFMRYKATPHPLNFGFSFMILALGLGLIMMPFGLWWLEFAVTVYFIAIYRLETGLPHWVAQIADADGRGKAMGIFSTAQSFGSFTGGAVAGGLWQLYSSTAVLSVLLIAAGCGGLALLKIGKNDTLNRSLDKRG